jgi:hypothetical protein
VQNNISHDNSSSGVVVIGRKLMPKILALHAKALFGYASMVGGWGISLAHSSGSSATISANVALVLSFERSGAAGSDGKDLDLKLCAGTIGNNNIRIAATDWGTI